MVYSLFHPCLKTKDTGPKDRGKEMDHKTHTSCCVTETIPGTWLVHDHDKPKDPISGVAVWQYSNGIIKCEQCGLGEQPSNPIKTDCQHIDSVRKYQGDKILNKL